MIELVIMSGAVALTLMSTALYLMDRDNDQLREENHRLREENRLLHIKADIPLREDESRGKP